MLAIPPATKFDLNFHLFRIPVRVSVWFWLVALMFNMRETPNAELLTWIVSLFVSILVHEFGHALTSKAFGDRPYVVLHGMGGVCVPAFELPFGRKLLMLFMGPGAQFLLLFGIFLYAYLAWNVGWMADWYLSLHSLGIPVRRTPSVDVEIDKIGRGSMLVLFTYYNLIRINLLWPLINLLPIWPLDGGQITQTLLGRFDRVNGARRTHIIGMVTAGLLAVYLVSRVEGLGDGMVGFFPVLFFGYFAFLNYQQVQAYHQSYYRKGSDDADWWKR